MPSDKEKLYKTQAEFFRAHAEAMARVLQTVVDHPEWTDHNRRSFKVLHEYNTSKSMNAHLGVNDHDD